MSDVAKRVLIFDMNNEYGEYGVKTIGVNHLPAFIVHPHAEIRRIAPFKAGPKGPEKMGTGEMLEMLEYVVGMYQGGCLVIEDPTKFFSKTVTNDLIGSICTTRHNSADLILHYQSVGRILPVLHENIKLYRFHHQGDDVYKSEGKLQSHTEMFKLGQIMVDQQYFGYDGIKKNKRFFTYLDKEAGKIRGNYTAAMVDDTFKKYLRLQPKEFKYVLNELDDFGNKRYTYPEAVAAYKKHLLDLYIIDNDPPPTKREAKIMVAIGEQGVGKTYETMRMLREDYCPSKPNQNLGAPSMLPGSNAVQQNAVKK